jgi:enoyl-CoA hydratase/carnithine racemase
MTTEADGEVRCEARGRVLVVEVDRREKRNAFTPELFDALRDALARLDAEPELWAGVLTFAGAHTTAGLDLPRFAARMAAGGETAPDPRPDAFGLERRVAKPLVMAVQGITFTIGIEMMLAADVVVAADDCRFCQMEPKRGLAVFGGAHVRYVQRAGWGNAMYHLLRADEFGAARAKELGFVQEVVPAGQQVARAVALAEEICANAPLAVREIKRAALVYLERGERAAFAEIPAMRRATAGSRDFEEGVASFVERRPPRFEGR